MKTIAICGNPNSGKTSVFNALTGAHQHVGNWPGVTVERKEGQLHHNGEAFKLIDLPGTYSLSANSLDEKVARDFIIEQNPDLTVIVMDQSNIERNFYLALEIIEMGRPVMFVLNMDDEAKKLGISIDEKGLSSYLNIHAVKTVANRKRGIEELKSEMAKAALESRKPKILSFSESLEKRIDDLARLFSGHYESSVKRWFAIKALEGDEPVYERLNESQKKQLEQKLNEMEKETGNEPDITLAEERYAVIHGIAKEFVHRVTTEEQRERLSTKIDAVITHRFWGIPIFALIMWLMFQLAFFVGGFFVEWVDRWFSLLGDYLVSVMPDTWLTAFITDAVIGGLGAFMVFLPQLFVLFLFISFLGDVGYMSRAAFVMDKFMHALGLHGKSFIPMLLGFGCTVPGIMAARTLESRKDRIITILVTPLMSCGARLPVYALLGGIFFPNQQGTVTFSLYMLGILFAILMARIFKKTLFKSEDTLFIMELPPYRWPSGKETFGQAFRNTWSFVKKAGTIIFAAVIVVWLLSIIPGGIDSAPQENLIGDIGKAIAPIFKPLGFEGWEATVALIFGILAKEIVVGTFGTLFVGQEFSGIAEYAQAGMKGDLIQGLQTVFTSPLAAYSFMLFVLLYTPCLAALATIKQEIGWKWMWFTALYLFALAYVVSFLVFNIGGLFF